jgi:serine/threonine protein kinase
MESLGTGDTVGPYRIERELGAGGLATVFLARHTVLGGPVAIKVLHRTDEGLRQRLLREGRAQSQLTHPNICRVQDVIELRSGLALVMEYLEGQSLHQWISAGSGTMEERLQVFDEIVAAVASAHAAGIVHRDLKPGNVMVRPASRGWTVKVMDFGLAKASEEEDGPPLTGTGVALGTPNYMAPEQIQDARNVDGRADCFALGCILYELLSGVRTFDGASPVSTMYAVVEGNFQPIGELVEGVPEPVTEVLNGLLTRDKGQRLADLDAVRRAIAPFAAGGAWPAPAPVPGPTTPSASTLVASPAQGAEPPTATEPSAAEPPASQPARRPPWILIATGLTLALILVGACSSGSLLLLLGRLWEGSPPPAEPETLPVDPDWVWVPAPEPVAPPADTGKAAPVVPAPKRRDPAPEVAPEAPLTMSVAFEGENAPTAVEVECPGTDYRQRRPLPAEFTDLPRDTWCKLAPKGVVANPYRVRGGNRYTCRVEGTTTTCEAG